MTAKSSFTQKKALKVINKVFSKLFQFLIMFALATMIYIIRHHFTKKKKKTKGHTDIPKTLGPI